MGNSDSKLNFRKAVIQLTTKTQPVEATDDGFWDQFWAVEKLVQAAESGCPSVKGQAGHCGLLHAAHAHHPTSLRTRLEGFFWSTVPGPGGLG
ncbi:hypothetical protein ANANG_G00002610 [Anguilla anguilla]|uniref:Uncharacterized protein n=1 Tax=Anguilla anguilla TaxID=7936 RepID=A0A9D3MWG6_ANGAN|nr:hypothetical protein ANANG_G00002610 [Anguilla anguilla]